MKFVSKEIVAGKRIEANIEFDADLIGDAELAEEGDVVFQYKFKNTTYFPFNFRDAVFVAERTRNNLYVTASLFVEGTNEETASIEPYMMMDDAVEFDIILSEEEKKEFLFKCVELLSE